VIKAVCFNVVRTARLKIQENLTMMILYLRTVHPFNDKKDFLSQTIPPSFLPWYFGK